MSEPDASHMDEIKLLTYADGELAPADAGAVSEHLAGCSNCRERLAELRSDLDDFITRHHERKRAAIQPQPSWPDLTPEFDRLDGRKVFQFPKSFVPSRVWFGAAAAALLAAVIWNLSTERTVSAAELLQRASARDFASEPDRRIVIQSRRHKFVRPARLAAVQQQPAVRDTAAELQALFHQANFSWDDPLSAASFARWRDQLPEKQDHVTVIRDRDGSGEKLYRIQTVTSHGILFDAALVMRAADLRPLRETLRFRDREAVEISETAPGIEPAPVEPPAPGPPRMPQSQIASEPGTPVGAAEELRVLAALNEIGADLGDPVEVKRDDEHGRLIVTGVGVDPSRQRQIRDSVREIAGVVVDFAQSQPLESTPSRGPVPPVTASRQSPLHRELEARLGAGERVESFIDSLVTDSESALARAHALSKLAARFPPDREQALSPADLQLLRDLCQRHVKALAPLSASIERRVQDVIGGDPEHRAGACGNWQACANSVLQASKTLDQVLNAAFAGTGPQPSSEAAALRSAVQNWREQIAGLERSIL